VKVNRWLVVLGILIACAVSASSGVALAGTASQEDAVYQRIVTFEELGFNEINLTAGSSTSRKPLQLPHAWVPQGISSLDLVLDYAHVDAAPTVLQVLFNNTTIGLIRLDTLPGDRHVTLNVPEFVWQRSGGDNRHTLRFELLSALGGCDDPPVRATIQADSTLTIVYGVNMQPAFTLDQLPFPFIPDNLRENNVVLVLPSSPTSADLEAASAIAARLGLSGLTPAQIHSTTDALFTPLVDGQDDLIVIGEMDTNTLIQNLASAEASSLAEGNGLILIRGSVWNAARAALVVAGSDPDGVRQAASAVLAEVPLPALTGRQVVIAGMAEAPAQEPLPLIGSFRSFGYETQTQSGDFTEKFAYRFDFPGGYRTQEGGFIELLFAHSLPVDVGTASLSLSINGISVGGIPLDEATSTGGRLRVDLPSDFEMWSGSNEITIDVQLPPQVDESGCARTDAQGGDWPWVTVYDSSYISIEAVPDSHRRITLADFPQPFVGNGRLDTLQFVVPEQPAASDLTALAQISAALGKEAAGDLFTPAVALGEALADAQRDLVIAIGLPSTNPTIAGVNEDLAQPLDPETNSLVQTDNPVQFVLQDNQDYGLIELLTAPGQDSTAVLVVTGTSDEAVQWAGQALADETLRQELSGNLVYVQGAVTTSFEVNPPAPEETVAVTPEPTQEPGAESTPEATPAPSGTEQPGTEEPAEEQDDGGGGALSIIGIVLGVLGILAIIIIVARRL
jgi:hypothetical protein